MHRDVSEGKRLMRVIRLELISHVSLRAYLQQASMLELMHLTFWTKHEAGQTDWSFPLSHRDRLGLYNVLLTRKGEKKGKWQFLKNSHVSQILSIIKPKNYNSFTLVADPFPLTHFGTEELLRDAPLTFSCLETWLNFCIILMLELFCQCSPEKRRWEFYAPHFLARSSVLSVLCLWGTGSDTVRVSLW